MHKSFLKYVENVHNREMYNSNVFPVLGIRIRRFLGLPDSDPLVRGRDPDPVQDPSVITQNSKKHLHSSCFYVTFYDFLSLKNDVTVASNSNKQKRLCKKIIIFIAILKVTDENSMFQSCIRIRMCLSADPVRNKMSLIPNTGFFIDSTNMLRHKKIQLTILLLISWKCISQTLSTTSSLS
jgi:hypothetical protein